MCECKWWDVLLVLVIIVFTLWTFSFSKWLVVAAAIVLLVCKYACKCCDVRHSNAPKTKKKK